jgi:response regulator NasT
MADETQLTQSGMATRIEHAQLPAAAPVVMFETARTEPWNTLSRNLRAMGFTVFWTSETDTRPPGSGASVVRLIQEGFVAPNRTTPFIMVASPGSANGAFDAMHAGASGYFVAPIDPRSVGTAIYAACQRAREFEELQQRAAKLSESLQNDQTVSTVVGILIERYRCQRVEAYERLRRYARSERRKVLEIAAQILATSEDMNRILTAIETVLPGESSTG